MSSREVPGCPTASAQVLECSSTDTFQSQEATGDQYVIIERDGEQRRGCLQM